MINIHGKSKQAIGEISNFPFSVGGIEIPIDVIVTDATFYCTIVEDDNTGYDNNKVRKDCHEKEQLGDQRIDQPGITCYVVQKEKDQCIADLFDYCYENETPAEVEYQIEELKADQEQ
ncbi:3248_t:CDS:2 [Cetraspora pellucida]|uniref:3248_t:CDS:1 n=1 Tax=Cetraspora pellucida TaxID=1433469 RepID=A0A9N9HKL7_9GLOM|nr:3248_t:CDS:2 [Cetraspora pellucida]